MTALDGLLRRFRRTAAFVALVAFASAVPGATPDDTVTLNFVNADIDAVVRAVAEITGKTFVVDPKVKGTVNIVSTRPVPRSVVVPTLLSALRLQGFTVVETEGVTKVVPEADAKLQGGAVLQGSGTATGDRLVTQVIALKYESASQLVNVLRPLISPNNTVAAFPGSNALVITDYADNLRRIDRIIAALDQAPAGEPVIIPVRYASAVDLVTMINRLLIDSAPVAAGDSQQRVALIADGRSNSILARSDNPGRIARVRQLVEQLDTPGRSGGNVFIVYLKNADATRVAGTLRALFGGGGDAATSSAPTAMTAGGTAAGAAGAAPTLATPAAAPTAFSAAGAMIQADVGNNALLIAAPEPVYNNLRSVIEKLDVRRAQVFVEALIVEIAADRAAELGVQWQALSGVGRSNTQGVGGTNFGARGTGTNIIDGSLSLASLGQGLNLGVINGSVTIPGLGVITNLALLVRALESDSSANILSTPTLLTLDNEEARIVVGQNVPFVTGQYTTTASSSSSVTPFQTIERKDVGLTLRVKPQITEGGSVRLAIYQEVSRVDDKTNPAGIITNKRSLESSVIVDDNQVVVLGGLITDTLTDGTDKVPLAGDVPVVGQLFRYDNRKRSKSNLMVFLKPTVVRSPASAAGFTHDRYDYLIGEQERFRPGERVFWNDRGYPTLPSTGMVPPSGNFAPPPPAPLPLTPAAEPAPPAPAAPKAP